MIPNDEREPARLDSLIWNGEDYKQKKIADLPQLAFCDVRGIARLRRTIAA